MSASPAADSIDVHSHAVHSHDVYSPRPARQLQLRPLAPRLDTLAGKTVAQLWDYIFRGDEIFLMLEEALKARYPGIRFVSWREFGSTHGNQEHEILASLPGKIRELKIDAVISGMGC